MITRTDFTLTRLAALAAAPWPPVAIETPGDRSVSTVQGEPQSFGPQSRYLKPTGNCTNNRSEENSP